MSARSLVSVIAGVGLLAMAAVVGLAIGQGTVLGQQGFVIDATPATDINEVNTDHTVTATVTLDLVSWEGADVTFEVTSGPNVGDNGSDITDNNGEATFTYPGDGGIGTDTIQACVFPIPELRARAVAALQQPDDCVDVEKQWVEPTPTPSPTPTATATPTATPSPTPTPPAEEAAGALPPTGSQPAEDADFPWAVVALALGALAVLASGATILRRAR